MYTQCAKCETVFRLSAEVLRAAGGQVRCGRCGEVFNALTRLEETPTAFTRGESALELESRADEILESAPVESTQVSDPGFSGEPEFTDREVARLEVLAAPEDDLESEMSLEFTLPPDDLDRVFVESAPNPLAVLTAARKSLAEPPGTEPSRTEQPPAEPDHVDPPQAELPSMTPLAMEPAAAPAAAGPTPTRTQTPAAKAAATGLSLQVQRDYTDRRTDAEFPFPAAPRRRIPTSIWLTAAGVLVALLIAQLVYDNGGWSALRLAGPGNGADAPSLSVYQLRQWGVTGDPNAQGTLRVRASILNASPQSQPFPLLRVTLADRFGNRVGRREFEAADYLGKAPPRPMGPGERADAMLDILDPGKQAEGFEIDLCLRAADGKLVCTGDAKPRPT